MTAEDRPLGAAATDDGIVILTLDDPARSANTMNAAYVAGDGARCVDRLAATGRASPA